MTALRDPDAGRRAQARAVARRLHPDLGGDPEAYLAAMAELDARAPTGATGIPTNSTSTASPAPTGPTGERTAVARVRRALRRRARTAARGARARLPRGLPGARRWARL